MAKNDPMASTSSFDWRPPARANDGVLLTDPRPEQRYPHNPSGNAGLEGYSQVSSADPATGVRKPVGGQAARTRPPIFEED